MAEPLPLSVCMKAQALERLLLRVNAGDPLDVACNDLGISVEAEDLPRLRQRYERGGQCWQALVDGRFGHGWKAHSALREWVYQRKRDQPGLSAEDLVGDVARQWGVTLSVGHMNHLLRKVGLTSRPGPRRRTHAEPLAERRAAEEETPAVASATAEQSLENAGVFP